MMTNPKTTKSQTKIETKKRIKVAIVGPSTITIKQSKDSARYILQQLTKRYDLMLIATVKEDRLGKDIRLLAKAMDIKLHTSTANDHADQWNPLELATADLMWIAKRFVVVSNGDSGCSEYVMEMCLRMKRKIKLFEL